MISRRQFLSTTAAAAAVGGCAVNPATRRHTFTAFYSHQDDIRLGKEEHPELLKMFGGTVDNTDLSVYISQIGARLAPHAEIQDYPYMFTVLDTPVVNAVALPGGRVYITRGLLLLAENEAEVAGVLGHELGHVNARHITERISQGHLSRFGLAALELIGGEAASYADLLEAGAGLYLKSFSRKQEYEADSLGVRYMALAGYDPGAMVTFLKRMRAHSIFQADLKGLPPGRVDTFDIMATHPRTVDRVKAAIAEGRRKAVKHPRINQGPYVRKLEGMLFGTSPDEGYVTHGHFVHPTLEFTLEVPPDTETINEPSRVTFLHPTGAFLRMDADENKQNRTLSAYLKEAWMPEARLHSIRHEVINGHPAVMAETEGRIPEGKASVQLAVIRGDGNLVYRFISMTLPQQSSTVALDFNMAIRSFRDLLPKEVEEMQPLKVHVRQARTGETVEKLAKDLPYGDKNSRYFRLINEIPEGAMPPRDKLLKVVRSG